MNRGQLKIYLYGDKDAQKESVDLTEINKDWDGKDLKNDAYGEFWKGDGTDPRKRGS